MISNIIYLVILSIRSDVLDELNKQLKKGVLEIIILKLISKEETYGYEIIKYLETESEGYYAMKEGSLYPILYRLEDKDLIESFRSESLEGRKVPRKYYRITEKGKLVLKSQLEGWKYFLKVTNYILERG